MPCLKNGFCPVDTTPKKITEEDGREISFVHKSRIHPKELHVNVTKPGQKKPSKKTVRVDQKQMVYYSEKYAKNNGLTEK